MCPELADLGYDTGVVSLHVSMDPMAPFLRSPFCSLLSLPFLFLNDIISLPIITGIYPIPLKYLMKLNGLQLRLQLAHAIFEDLGADTACRAPNQASRDRFQKLVFFRLSIIAHATKKSHESSLAIIYLLLLRPHKSISIQIQCRISSTI